MPESYWERSFQNLERFSLPILLIVVLIALILIYVFYPNNSVDQNTLRLEFVKLLIQLLLIGLFGGIFVSIFGGILLQEYNRRRERNIELNEFRKKLLADLTHSYFKAKKARRILDANIVRNKENQYPSTVTDVAASDANIGKNKENKDKISYTVYETQIKEIIDAQLEFEFYHHQLNAIHHIFSDKTNLELVYLTRQIEKNLNDKIIKEYRDLEPPEPPKSDKELTMAQLPGLNEFITTKTFRQNFSKPAHEAFKLIQDEIF